MGHIIMDCIFVAVAAIIILISAKRGFIANLLRSTKWILSFVFAYFFGTRVGSLFCEWFLGDAVRNFVYGKVDAIYREAETAFGAEQVLQKLPSFLISDDLRAKLEAAEGNGEQLVSSFTDSIATPVSTLLSNILGYVAVFLVSLILLWILVKVLDGLMEHIKLLGTINTILGFVWGVLLSAMLLLMAASVVKLFFADAPIYQNSVVVRFLGDSFLLEFLRFLDIGGTWLGNLF